MQQTLAMFQSNKDGWNRNPVKSRRQIPSLGRQVVAATVEAVIGLCGTQ